MEWYKACRTCSTRKMTPPHYQEGTLHPMKIFSVDILGSLPVTAESNRYVLVACECFTRWFETHAIRNQEALTVAKVLVNEMFCHYSTPEQLHSV